MDERLDEPAMSDKHEEIADEAYERGFEAGMDEATDKLVPTPWCKIHNSGYQETDPTCWFKRLFGTSIYKESICEKEDPVRHWSKNE